MPSYKVLSPLLHDGKRYEIGEIVELEPSYAAALTEGVELLLDSSSTMLPDSSTPPLPEIKNTPAKKS